MHFLILILLISSCATKKLTQTLDHEKYDLFKEETFLRYTKERLPKTSTVAQELHHCYNGDFSDAFDSLKNRLDKNTKNPEYWNAYGICYFLKEDLVKADYFFGLALSYSKNKYLPAYNNLGMSALKRRDYQSALSYFELITQNKRSNLRIPLYNMAQIYLEHDRADLALDLLTRLHKQNNKDPDIIISIAVAYLIKQKPDKASYFISQLFKKRQDNTDVVFYKALILFEKKEWKGSKEILESRHFTKTLILKRFAKKMLRIVNTKLVELERQKSIKKG
jgi:Flp pilus assembly protein TadD